MVPTPVMGGPLAERIRKGWTPRVIVVGASAGAVDALGKLLPALPRTMTVPIAVVVHLPPTRPSAIVELFREHCALPVAHPLDKQPITPGIWFAAPDYHLLVEEGGTFAMSLDEQVNFSRPSIDVLFESAADAYREHAVAIVLTGANADGARGAQKISRSGGVVMVQDPEEAEIDVMPRAAIAIAEPEVVAPLEELAATLAAITGVTQARGPGGTR